MVESLDPAGGQRRDLEWKQHRSLMLINSPDWLPPQIAIDLWWKDNGIDHETIRNKRNELYRETKIRSDEKIRRVNQCGWFHLHKVIRRWLMKMIMRR